MKGEGLPHSEIPGSTPACGSPRLIAACYVLHRQSKPRHPPYALSSLTNTQFTRRNNAVVKEQAISARLDGGADGQSVRARSHHVQLVDLSGIEPLTS